MNRRLQWKLMDNFRRKIFLKNEIKKKILKSLIKNKNTPLVYRYVSFWNLTKISRLTSFTKHQNRCVATGRNNGVVKLSHYSRFFFRTESYKGNLPGVSRASW